MAEDRGERIQVEQAFHVVERREARRKLLGGAAKAVAAGVAAVSVLAGVGNAIEQGKKESYQPDSYYNGRIEIVMSDNLNLREYPVIISTPGEATQEDGPNTVDWNDVDEINGVKVEGSESFVIANPLITEGESPEGPTIKGSWITFDAKVDGEKERLYVSFSPATNDYVKPIESGTFIKLDPAMSTDGLGSITVTP